MKIDWQQCVPCVAGAMMDATRGEGVPMVQTRVFPGDVCAQREDRESTLDRWGGAYAIDNWLWTPSLSNLSFFFPSLSNSLCVSHFSFFLHFVPFFASHYFSFSTFTHFFTFRFLHFDISFISFHAHHPCPTRVHSARSLLPRPARPTQPAAHLSRPVPQGCARALSIALPGHPGL